VSIEKDKFLTIQEAAEFLKVSKITLRRWSNTGKLSCFRIGARNERRFKLEDLMGLISDSSSIEQPSQLIQGQEKNKVKGCVAGHVSSYYRDETEQWQILKPYFQEFLTPASKIIYIHDNDEQTFVKNSIFHGFDPRDLIRKGQLELFSSKETYLLDNVFIPERMLLFWQIKIAHFMKEGTEKIFLSGEMAWALRGLPGCQLLSDYESELDQFLSHYPKVTVLCQYPLRHFSGESIVDSMCKHPTLQMKDQFLKGFSNPC